MAKSQYQLLIFDWDGTLCDTAAHVIQSIQTSIAELELPERDDEQIKSLIGLNIHDFVRTLYPELDVTMQSNLINQYRLHYFTDPEAMRLYPDVKQTLLRLKSLGFILAIATGKGRAGLELGLEQTSIAPLISGYRCADNCPSKPNPQMIIELMEEFQVKPEQTVLIGDTEYDMELAKNAGVTPLAVSYGVHDVEQLASHDPVEIFQRLSDLVDWLEK